MPRRPRSPDGPATIDVRVSLSPSEAAILDAARGDALRADWLREAGLRDARRVVRGLSRDAELPPPDPRAAIRATEARIDAELARVPRLPDPAIAEVLGLTVDVVRRHREARGIAPAPPKRSGWQDTIRAALARGLTVAEIATETGWSEGTVRTRISAVRKT